MKIEIATEQSVLVELSAEELREWNLTYDRIGEVKTQTRAVLQSVLQEVQARTGRKIMQQGMEIDLLPARGGGCLLIITGSRGGEKHWESCAVQDENALLDLLAAFGGSALQETSAAVFQTDAGFLLVLCDVAAAQRRLLREFGSVASLSPLGLASLRERCVLLKVFGGA